MFDAPVDAWYLWVGLALASLAFFGIALDLPNSAAPNAAAVADTVDTTATSERTATATYPLRADAIKVGPRRVSIRGDGGTEHATFVYGPVTPVSAGSPLWEVARGTPPEHVFDSPAAFRRAVRVAQSRPVEWKAADEKLVVRHVSWEGTDATLVDA